MFLTYISFLPLYTSIVVKIFSLNTNIPPQPPVDTYQQNKKRYIHTTKRTTISKYKSNYGYVFKCAMYVIDHSHPLFGDPLSPPIIILYTSSPYIHHIYNKSFNQQSHNIHQYHQ